MNYTEDDLKEIQINIKDIERKIRNKLGRYFKIASFEVYGDKVYMVVSFHENMDNLWVHRINFNLDYLNNKKGLYNIVDEKYEWHRQTLGHRLEVEMSDEILRKSKGNKSIPKKDTSYLNKYI